ncbi:hypothetical protein K502DRAFT_349776 [Neoconidiobolus thromboides FSU 785]|nr:hypothetical protein K502DRAFT_349776 [Neoconidiobolus thromboides FSU 785]
MSNPNFFNQFSTDIHGKVKNMIQQNMNSFSDAQQNFDSFSSFNTGFQPNFETEDKDNELLVTLKVSGFTKDDLKVSLLANHLSVSGNSNMNSQSASSFGNAFSSSSNAFSRSMELPNKYIYDGFTYEMNDNVLKIVVKKKN